MYRTFLTAILGAAILLSAGLCRGDTSPATQPAGGPKTGDFDIVFTQRSPLSARAELAQRLNLKESDMGDDYDLSKRPFKIYVPSNYDPSAPVGIFVYLGYKDSIATPPQWHALLDKSHLIFITPTTHSGEQYPPAVPRWQTIGQALDAVDNLKKLYHVDEKRIYEMAWAQEATPTALASADVFTGFVITADVGWFRRIYVGNMYYNPTFSPPEGRFISLALPHPFVLISQKGNDDSAQGIARKAAEMKREDFDHILQISLSLGDDLHCPNLTTNWLTDEALPFLDKNATAIAMQAASSGGASTAPSPGGGVAAAPEAPSKAQSLLSVAKLLLANNQADLARAKLQEIVKNYPNDPAAPEARKLLDQIGK